MKKILLIVLIVFLVVGCDSSEKLNNELEKKLMNQAKEIFETDAWTKGGINVGTYTLTLRDLKEDMKLDISEYKNSNTDEACDIDKSKIDFIVSEQTEPDKTNYELKVTIVCGEE